MSVSSLLDNLISTFSNVIPAQTMESSTEQSSKQLKTKQTKQEKQKKKKLSKQQRMKMIAERKKQKELQLQQTINAAKSIKEDSSLPLPTYIKIRDATKFIQKRVHIRGWFTEKPRYRRSSKIMFFNVFDSTDYPSLHCVIKGNIFDTKESILLRQDYKRENAVLSIHGKIVTYDKKYELRVDYFKFLDPFYFMNKEIMWHLGWKQRCEFVIYGYVRLELNSKELFELIPNEIKQLIMLFLGDIWNDYWDLKTVNKHIKVIGNTVQTTAPYGTMSRNSIFGTKIVYGFPKYESYKWRLEMVYSNEYGNRHCFFGIIPEMNVSDEMYGWFVDTKYGGYGYCHRNGLIYHNTTFDFGYSKDMEYGIPLNAKDIMEIYLDLNARTLRYCVNGKDFGTAFADIPINTNYRLAITMGWNGEAVKLLKSI